MPKTSYIDAVRVKKPCTEEWEQMTGTDKLRFCSHCAKHVNDISSMTRSDARQLVRRSGGNLCIRYIEDPATKRPLFAEQLVRIQRRSPRLAAGVMSASMSLAAITYGQDDAPPPVPLPQIERHNDEKAAAEPVEAPHRRPRIIGTIVDPAGAVIPGTTVTIFNVEKNLTATTTSGNEGGYVFENLEPGKYWIESESPGFRKSSIASVEVRDNYDSAADIELEVGGFEIVVNVEMEVGDLINIVGGIMAFAVEYSTTLAKAVADDEIDRVRDLLIAGEDVNGKDEGNGKGTPIFIAIDRGSDEIVQLLIDFGADVNARNDDGQTPLMQLDSDSTAETVEMLVSAGANVNVDDDEGNTPLIIAAEYATADVVKALIDAGADVNAANKEGDTPLIKAAWADDIESVRMLLAAGANVNARNKKGENALDQTSDDEIEELLRSRGSDARTPEDDDQEDDDEPDTVTP